MTYGSYWTIWHKMLSVKAIKSIGRLKKVRRRHHGQVGVTDLQDICSLTHSQQPCMMITNISTSHVEPLNTSGARVDIQGQPFVVAPPERASRLLIWPS